MEVGRYERKKSYIAQRAVWRERRLWVKAAMINDMHVTYHVMYHEHIDDAVRLSTDRGGICVLQP